MDLRAAATAARARPFFVELTPRQVRQAKRLDRFVVRVDPIVEQTAEFYGLTLLQAAYAIDVATTVDGDPAPLFYIVPEDDAR